MTTGAPARDPARPVEVSTRFERFPAAIKGAFVMWGADGLPHSVRLRSAEAARIPDGPVFPIALGDVSVHVAPSRELFVPFDVALPEDSPPGWYVIRSSVVVDAGRVWEFSGRPFLVAWGRGENRRGTIEVGRPVRVGDVDVDVLRVELRPDAAVVSWVAPPGAEPALTLAADGVALPGVPLAAIAAAGRSQGPVGRRPAAGPAEASGEGRTATYPVPAAARSLDLVVSLPSGERSEFLRLRLP